MTDLSALSLQSAAAVGRGLASGAADPVALTELLLEKISAAGDSAGAAELFEELQPVLAFSNQSLEISIRFFSASSASSSLAERVPAVVLYFNASSNLFCRM